MHVLIVDDHSLFRVGLSLLLQHVVEHVRVSQAGNTAEALGLMDQGEVFDLVLLDWHIPGDDMNVNLGVLMERGGQARLVVVSGDTSPELMARALELGAAGFISKSSSTPELVGALQRISEGGVYLPRDLFGVDSLGAASGALPGLASTSQGLVLGRVAAAADQLTARQRDVLQALSKGLSNKQIAQQLGIAEDTVKQHVSAVYAVLSVHSRAQALHLLASKSTRG